MATQKTFLYFEVEVSQSTREAHNANPAEDNVGFVIAQTLDQMIEGRHPQTKLATTLQEFVHACKATFAYKDDTNTGAICLEFLTRRDYDRREAIWQELSEYFSNEGITVTHDVVRHIDINKMKITGLNNEADSYWKTKIYFNETLPVSRGFSTECLLDDAAEGATYMDYWTREL